MRLRSSGGRREKRGEVSWELGREEEGAVVAVVVEEEEDEEDMSAKSFTARECVGAGLARLCLGLFRRFRVILPNTDV